ncbi:MAG: thioesterase, partial [Stomatobaculum sp.]|nr:thioesterase [Stomatobaculum sp.]
CRHLAPTPVGMKVTATAKLKKTEGRKMWFDIEVHDEKGLCGKGSHLRVKVNSKAMKDKGAAKAQT